MNQDLNLWGMPSFTSLNSSGNTISCRIISNMILDLIVSNSIVLNYYSNVIPSRRTERPIKGNTVSNEEINNNKKGSDGGFRFNFFKSRKYKTTLNMIHIPLGNFYKNK